MSNSLQPHESQHARLPCPSPTLGVYPNSCPLIQWCHPAISSSVVPFSSCPQSLPASGSFPISQLFPWGGQSIGVSDSTSVLPMNTQDWSPLGCMWILYQLSHQGSPSAKKAECQRIDAQRLRHLPAMWETQVQSLGWEDPLEKEMATHSSILTWRIPWMKQPGRLQSTGSQRVGHYWATSLHFRNWCFWTVVLEKTLESPLDCKEIQPVHPKRDQSWVFIGRTDVEAETSILWPPDAKRWLIGKDPDPGRDLGQEEKGTTEDEMVGWYHWVNEHEFE